MRKKISDVGQTDTGELRCPHCGGAKFTEQRSKKGKRFRFLKNSAASSSPIFAVPNRRVFLLSSPGRTTGFGRWPFPPDRCQFAAASASTAAASRCSTVPHSAAGPCIDRDSADVGGRFA